jgi:TolA-binding protein
VSLAKYGDGRGPAVNVSGSAQGGAAKASADGSGAFNEASALASQGRYEEAIKSFKAIVDSGAAPELTAKSSYEIGRCMFMMNKYEESLRYMTNMLTQYPKHPNLTDAIFIMGQCNEKTGRRDQAAAFYKKIISMSSGGNTGAAEKAKKALGAMGA